MALQENDPVNWTYNGLTTRCTLLTLGLELSQIRYRAHNPPYALVETWVPTDQIWEVPLADGSGQQLYKVAGPADDLRILADSATDLGLIVKVRTQHYLIMATAKPDHLTRVLSMFTAMTQQRLPGRIQ